LEEKQTDGVFWGVLNRSTRCQAGGNILLFFFLHFSFFSLSLSLSLFPFYIMGHGYGCRLSVLGASEQTLNAYGLLVVGKGRLFLVNMASFVVS